MKTYAEAEGKNPFDWNAFLDNPPKANSCRNTSAEHRAARWATCACGNQCNKIPRDRDGAPVDKKLNLLGIEFYRAIENADWAAAKKFLSQIEQRSAELLSSLK